MAVAKATNIPINVKWLQITATDADWKKIGKAECTKMLTHLHIIRAFEELLWAPCQSLVQMI
jgi:TPP-dependent pyruvate/acetoin dehydrogenase alpha subunit